MSVNPRRRSRALNRLDELRASAAVRLESCSSRIPPRSRLYACTPRSAIADRLRPPHVVHVIAARIRTRRIARPRRVPECPDRVRPVGRIGDRIRRRRHAARQSVLLQRIALALIELPDGRFERAGQPLQLAGRRVAQAAIEQGGGDPHRRGQRQDGGGQKRENQALAHRFIRDRPRRRCSRPKPERARFDRLAPAESSWRRKLNASINPRSVKPASPSEPVPCSPSGIRVVQPNPEWQLAAQPAERAHRHRQLVETPGFGGRRGQVRHRSRRRADQCDGKSFFPEIVAQDKRLLAAAPRRDRRVLAAPRARARRERSGRSSAGPAARL